jgi:hypothetical protein
MEKWGLVFLSLFFVGFLILRFYLGQKLEIQEIKEKIKDWWDKKPDEKIFQEKIEIFLEEFPRPKKRRGLKKAQKILREIQCSLQKDFLREDKISHDVFEILIDKIERKRKDFAF